MASAQESSAESSAPNSDRVDVDSSSPQSLYRAVFSRRSEYVRSKRMRVKIGTWNVAACPGTDKDLARWFVDGPGLDTRLASFDPSYRPALERTSATDGAGRRGTQALGEDNIGLYVLGLQEIVDLNTTSYVTRAYNGESNVVVDKWKEALQAALPEGYQLVAGEDMVGLLLLVFASPEVAPTVSNVSTVKVGTGLLGYLGNKGATVARIVVGESTRMVFVNCHLASGDEQTYIDRRLWDMGQILSRTEFTPISYAGLAQDSKDKIGEEDFCFWFGDLNFRLDRLPGDDIRRLLMLHTRGEYDMDKHQKSSEDAPEGDMVLIDKTSDSSDETIEQSSATTRSTDDSGDDDSLSLPDSDEFVPDPHGDPASLQATLDSLLPHDQLRRLMKANKVLQDGWQEGPIGFLPTYKYDVGTVGLFDSSEKRRAPSWCDRVLYRTRADKEAYEHKMKEQNEARKRDEEMKAQGLELGGDDDADYILFDYDPDTDGDDQPPPGIAAVDGDVCKQGTDDGNQAGRVDPIHLDLYTSDQQISSSDHKPIVSIFTLDYDAVEPDLKAKTHAEVAWELDRTENEGRPGITIDVDRQRNGARTRSGDDSSDLEDDVVSLGEAAFLGRSVTWLTVANTGRVPATFSFVDKPTTGHVDAPTKPWLQTAFACSDTAEDGLEARELEREARLEPGETVRALLQVLITDPAHARSLNDGQAKLEDVLVLHVMDGKDHFIPVWAEWTPTCIGRSVEELVRVPDGGITAFARSLPSGPISYDLPVHAAVPKELIRLTEAIELLTVRVLADTQMLADCQVPNAPGWPFEAVKAQAKETQLDVVCNLIDALDKDKPVNQVFPPQMPSMQRLELVCEAFLRFLGGLRDGIVTIPLWARIEQASLASLGQKGAWPKAVSDRVSEQDKITVLNILSSAPHHHIVFVILISSLTKIISELSPLSQSDVASLPRTGETAGVRGFLLGRQSLSFRRGAPTPLAEAAAALGKRKVRERRFAEIFGKIVCRAPVVGKDKERRLVEEKQRVLVEMFLTKRDTS